MQFNDLHYQQMRETVRATVKSDDQSWRGDIGVRYGHHLLERCENKRIELVRLRDEPGMATDQGKAYLENEDAALEVLKNTANAYVLKQRIVEDPVEIEVTLRIYKSATTPAAAE